MARKASSPLDAGVYQRVRMTASSHDLGNRFADYGQNANDMQGWFPMEFLQVLAVLDAWQREQGEVGGVVEIGVHSGRSLIPLAMTNGVTEVVLGIDCFDEQQANRSGSGVGPSRQRTLGNMSQWLLPDELARVQLLQADSRELTREDILFHMTAGQRVRLFHVDGCHHPETSYLDQCLAAQCLGAHGLILIDDIFRSRWPGVTEAAVKFLSNYHEAHELCAIAVTDGKMIVGRREFSLALQQRLRQLPGEWLSVPFCGSSNLVRE